MKNILKIAAMIIAVICVYIYKDSISTFITDEILYKGSNKVLTYNEYYLNNDYKYVQNTDSNTAGNKQELLNILYSIINSGDDSYTFKCNYDECINDIKDIINNEETISTINSFVHPYNSFSSITIDINELGKITVMPKKVYSELEIIAVNQYVDEFIKNNVNDSMNDYDKVKIFHDYIIDNTVYDDSGSKEYYTAYSLITFNKSICGGYSDIISIYLNKLGIKNYKVTSINHVWNLINIDNKWLHLDATWDDPVASDGNQYLLYNFFLIDTNELLSLDTIEHTFNRNIYMEAN